MTRRSAFFPVAVLAFTCTAGTHAYAEIRTSSPGLAALIRTGTEVSPTLRRLSESIEASDGIVYIEQGYCGNERIRACLAHRITISGENRMLYVFVDDSRAKVHLLGAIGHELQHALEVLRDPTIRTGLAVKRLYWIRGVRVGGVFETYEAIDAGNAVREELVRARR